MTTPETKADATNWTDRQVKRKWSVVIATAIVNLIHNSKWEYGTCRDRFARRNRRTGEVQFILWHKGEKQGDYVYTEDFWHRFDPSWWPEFNRTQREAK